MKYGFMAGCALNSSSPENVEKVIHFLRETYPDLKVVQGCCGRPTKLMGEQELYEERFQLLTDKVIDSEIETLILACQGCLSVMKSENKFATKSLWVMIDEMGLPKDVLGKAVDSNVVFSIHDSCPTKEMVDIHQAVRNILTDLGYKVKKNRLSGKNTICCGMGGLCGVTNPELTKEHAEKRVENFKTSYIATYCATCTSAMILGGGQAFHLLDLIFGDVVYENK